MSITSSALMLRATFKAKHSRVYASTIDSHLRLPMYAPAYADPPTNFTAMQETCTE